MFAAHRHRRRPHSHRGRARLVRSCRLLLAADCRAALSRSWRCSSFSTLGERVGLHGPFANGRIACAAGALLRAVFARTGRNAILERRSVRLSAPPWRGVLSLEAGLLRLSVRVRPLSALATRAVAGSASVSIGSAPPALLFVALPFSYLVRINEIPRDRPPPGAVHAVPDLGGRHARLFRRPLARPRAHGAAS